MSAPLPLPELIATPASLRLPAVRVEIDSSPMTFETDCAPAMASLDSLLCQTFSGRYYSYALGPVRDPETLPVLRYLDSATYETSYDATADVFIFRAPWAEVRSSTLIPVWLHLLAELVRQRRGEYLLHASAVERDGDAIVLVGEEGAGKTTCALDLCRQHGFRLYANNRLKIALVDGQLRLLKGDAVFRLRYSSVRKYDEQLAERFFGSGPGEQPAWECKLEVEPGVLGIEVASPTPRVAALVMIRLDAESGAGVVRRVESDSRSHDAFEALAHLSHAMSVLIRGASVVPLLNGQGFREIFVPCLDRPEFVQRRVALLRALFATGAVLRIRAPLDRSVEEIVRLFDARSGSPTASTYR
jgi:hypothetical protein